VNEQIVNRDPGDEQPGLFDPDTTVARLCPSCRTTRKNLCRHDADVRHEAIPASAKRPRGCLNAHDPTTAPFPEGY
jgi:hypothetical protein